MELFLRGLSNSRSLRPAADPTQHGLRSAYTPRGWKNGIPAPAVADDVPRTFIHFVEHGRSRPSQAVLALIARRTHKPISYFMMEPVTDALRSSDLAADLTRVGERVTKFAARNRLTKVEREAMR